MIRLRQKNKTKVLAYMGVMVAMLIVLAQISFPLPLTTVPISLGLLGVLIAGAILGPIFGTLSVGIYIILGLIGVPVFAGFRGGFSVLAGATGGYIVGYVFAAACVGLISYLYENNTNMIRHGVMRGQKVNSHFNLWNYVFLYFGMFVAVCICYAFGTAWFSVVSNLSFLESLSLCVLPFILGDIVKIIVAGCLSPVLQKIIK